MYNRYTRRRKIQTTNKNATLKLNKDYLIAETSAFIQYSFPDFVYNDATCRRDLGLIIDSLRIDVNRGTTANSMTRTAGERYYSV